MILPSPTKGSPRTSSNAFLCGCYTWNCHFRETLLSLACCCRSPVGPSNDVIKGALRPNGYNVPLPGDAAWAGCWTHRAHLEELHQPALSDCQLRLCPWRLLTWRFLHARTSHRHYEELAKNFFTHTIVKANNILLLPSLYYQFMEETKVPPCEAPMGRWWATKDFGFLSFDEHRMIDDCGNIRKDHLSLRGQ